MKKDIIFSQIDFMESSTKDKIIQVLSTDWPLTTKEINYRVARISQIPLSYQAIHKTLTQLVHKGIVEKTHNKKLQLNIEWIIKVEKFGSTLHSAYFDKKKSDLKDLYKETQVNLDFENPLELGVFLCNTFFHYPNPENKPTAMHIRNNYPLIGMSIRDVIALKQSLNKTKIYCLVSNDTLADRFLANFYILEGTEFKFGVKCAGVNDIIVRADYVCNIYWPENLLQKWTSLNRKVKYLKNFNLSDWFSLINTKQGKIYLNITKNPELADKIRVETIAHFKDHKK